MRAFCKFVRWLIYGQSPSLSIENTHTHIYAHTLNNADGIIAEACVLNELWEEGIYGQQLTVRFEASVPKKLLGGDKIIIQKHNHELGVT